MKRPSPEPAPLQEYIGKLKDGVPQPFLLCNLLADNVAQLMEEQCYTEALTCLRAIADAYSCASCNLLRIAIENVLLYRLGSHIFCSRYRTRLLQMLPPVLHDKLMQQMMASGI